MCHAKSIALVWLVRCTRYLGLPSRGHNTAKVVSKWNYRSLQTISSSDCTTMPQGKLKTKVQLPAGTKKQKQKIQKKSALRKGHLSIAPKKAKLIEAAKIKKGLERQVVASIEQEAVARAATGEHKQLHILKAAKGVHSVAKKQSNKK